MRPKNNLTEGPIGPALIAFALPTLMSSVLQSANGSIDTIWVGRLLGENAVAATTNGNIVVFLLTAFVFGFGMASTILIGQSMGREDVIAARRVVGTVVGTFLPVSVLLGVAGWFLSPSLLALLETPASVVPLAQDFLQVVFLALPAILIMTMVMMALRGSGDAVTPLIFMALAVVLCAGLNPVFILGLGPLPRLGIGGSALAMAVANYISLAAMFVYVYRRDLPLRLRGAELAYLKPDMGILRLMVVKGLPMGLQMIVLSGSLLAMMSLVNQQGVHTTAAFGATQQLWTYVQMPAMAIGAAVSAMAAQNIGAGRWDRVAQITRLGILYNVGLTGILIVVLMLADRAAMTLFLGSGSEAIAIGQHITRLVTWGFVPFAVTMVLFATVRANGQVIWPLIILFVSMFPVRLGFAYGLQAWLGADAIWLSFPAGTIATMVLAALLYTFGDWREERDMRVPDGDSAEASALAAAASGETAGAPGATVASPARRRED